MQERASKAEAPSSGRSRRGGDVAAPSTAPENAQHFDRLSLHLSPEWRRSGDVLEERRAYFGRPPEALNQGVKHMQHSRGAPLAEDASLRFGTALGIDTGGILHTGDEAALAASAINARAGALGRHIYFGKGEYQPDKRAARVAETEGRTLVHDLFGTEGLSRTGAIQAKLSIRQPGDADEQEADRIGLATREANTPKAESARTPASKARAPSALHTPPGFSSGAGNLAIQPLAADPSHSRSGPVFLQRELTVGSVDDPLEHEADRVAEHVMRMPALLEPIDSSAPHVQRKCACGETCDNCRTDAEQGMLQRKVAARPTIGAAGASASTSMHAPSIVHDVLRSPGQPLPSYVRALFEPRFGADFSQVRVHTDAAAQQSAQDMNANAYTAGQNVVFGTGRFAPETQEGQRLLAHELTHVVQQSGSATGGGSSIQPFSLDRRSPQGIVQRQMCTDILNAQEVPDKTRGREVERLVRVELITLLGGQNVIPSLPIPGASSRLLRDEGCGGFQEGKPPEEGWPDLSFRQYPRGRTLELAEVKIGTWPCMVLAEQQVDNYVHLANQDADYKRHMGVDHVEVMPTSRFAPPQLYAPDGTPVMVGWCSPGVIVYKAVASEKEEEPDDEPKDKKPKGKEPGPSPIPSLPELVTLGAKVAGLLAADAMLSAALSFVGTVAAALSPLLALAALAIGVVFLWDTIKSFAHLITGVARFVLDKISSVVAIVLDTIKEIGIKIGELAVWVGGLIKGVAEKIAEGLLFAGRKIISGARWLGGKIADGAEAVWDWLFGSDVEPMIVPNIEMPITEEPRHCSTVAHEDGPIQIDADLLFPTGEFELTNLSPAGQAALEDAAAKVLATPRTSGDPIRFLGYADVIGGPDMNQQLSEQRAGAVAEWFVAQGVIPRSKVRIEGFGETRAKAKPNDEEGRKRDRRVDILVTKPGGSVTSCW